MTSPEVVAEQEAVEALIEDMRTDPRDVLRRIRTGDTDVDAALERPMGVVSTQDNKVTIYHMETGDARSIPATHLRKTLEKRLPDGRRAFSIRPTVTPVKGNIKCYLHPEHPDNPKLRAAGIITTCMSGHFISVVDMEAQMAHKHSRDWAKIKELREQERRDEDREFQRSLMQAVVNGRMPEAAAPVVHLEEPVTVGTEAVFTEDEPDELEAIENEMRSIGRQLEASAVEVQSDLYPCDEEGCDRRFPSQASWQMHKNWHKRKVD